MRIHHALLALLPFLDLASGAPTADDSAAGSFSIHQVDSGRHKLKSGPHEIKRTFERYGKKAPKGILDAVAAAQVGTVAANPEQYDRAYLSPVSIGTPAQTLMMDFDTGSSDLWPFSNFLPARSRAGHSIYTPARSSTGKRKAGYTWSIRYGDGSGARGIVYSDKVVIGGATATSQAVEAATSVSAQFVQDRDNDGLVGLGFSSNNNVSPVRQTTFFDTIRPTLALPVFASYLRHQAAGKYDFGKIDTTKYTGDLAYAPVDTSNGFWEFLSSGYVVGSTSYTLPIDAIADTGTSLIYAPTQTVNNYWTTVNGARIAGDGSTVVFPCTATLPDLSFIIGGVARRVPGSFLNYAPYGGGYCVGGMQYNTGIGFSIFGDVFLKSQYVVFDAGQTRIGFGQAV